MDPRVDGFGPLPFLYSFCFSSRPLGGNFLAFNTGFGGTKQRMNRVRILLCWTSSG
jgi:hypothetical protein